MKQNNYILARLKTVLFSIILTIFFCQPVYALVQVNILYDEANSSSRSFKEQLVRTFLTYDIHHQTFDLKQFENNSLSDDTSSNEQIYITLGSKALKTAWEKLNNKKIFSLLVSQHKIKTIVEISSHINKLSGLYLEQSPQRQVLLAQQLISGIRTIGFLTTPHNAGMLRKQLKNVQSEIDFEIKDVSDQYSLAKALSYIIRNSELLITLPEHEIYNRSSLKNILLSSYRNNIPLIGLNKAFVNAGCLAAAYTTTKQFTKETAEIFEKITKEEAVPEIHYAKDYKISVNQKVADSLGLYLQSEKAILFRMTSNERKLIDHKLRDKNE